MSWPKQDLSLAARLCQIAYSKANKSAELFSIGWRLLADIHDDDTDATGYFAQDLSNQNNYAMVFRGTDSTKNKEEDFDIEPVHALGGTVHDGFWTAYSSIAAQAAAQLEPLSSGSTLLITGHSLGAAMATLLAVDRSFHAFPPKTRLVTLGGPRVGFRDFVDLFEEKLGTDYVRVCLEGDPVSQIPFSPYRHPGGIIQINENGVELGPVKRNLWMLWFWVREVLNAGVNFAQGNNIPNHGIGLYRNAINQMPINR